MSKLFFYIIINTILLLSQTKQQYLVLEDCYRSKDSTKFLILSKINTDSIFVIKLEEEYNPILRKINKNDILSLDLKLRYYYDTNSNTNQNYLIWAVYYNKKSRKVYIDDKIKSGYLPDSCFINKNKLND